MEDGMEIRIKSPYDPTIPLLGIYPEETKIENTHTHTHTHTHIPWYGMVWYEHIPWCSLQHYLQ